MKKKLSRICCILFVLIFSLSTNLVFAENANVAASYSVDSAIRAGIENSIILQQLDNKLTLSELKYDSYKKSGRELLDGEDDLNVGETDLDKGLSTIGSSQDILNQARIDILNGYYPQDFPNQTIIAQMTLPGGIILPALVVKSDHDSNDADRKTIVVQVTEYKTANAALLAVIGVNLDPAATAAQIIDNVDKEINKQQKALDKGKVDYEKNSSYLVDGKIDYEIAKASIASALADQLDISELNDLSAEYEVNLLNKMADAAANITAASKGIYRNQIALLIQNSYYNVLKAEKLVKVKESSVKKAEQQFEFAKESYETGMKAKDDMLLADLYLTGTKLEFTKAQDDYNNALIELKKNMNVPMDQEIGLEDDIMNTETTMDLSEGLKHGLNYRLEVIKAEKAVEIYDLNLDYVKVDYKSNKTRSEEAESLKDNADLELQKAKSDVESSIRQSYNTMLTMQSMLETAKDMTQQAQECVDIAQYKYKEGFGTESSLLKKAGMESASGTVLEVISAEENLAQVEEKYIQILYGYNLAKAKYLIDIGYLTY